MAFSFSRPFGVAVLGLTTLGLTLFISPLTAHAQTASRIDPQARILLDEMAAAHQALTGLKATLIVEDYGATNPQERTIILAFHRPDQARAAIADRTGPIVQFTTDGKALIIYSVHDKQYTRRDPPTGAGAIAEVLGQTQALLPTLLARPAILTRLLVQPGVQVAGAGTDTVSGVAVDLVTVTPAARPGTPRLTLSFAVGRKDHLLRRVTESVPVARTDRKTMQFRSAMHTETVTKLTADPSLTARDFAFTPPAGVTKMVRQAEAPMHDPRLVPGARPFPIAAKDLSGQPLSLAQYQGKVVLMDFWAAWCGPCVGEMPNVIAAYKKYHAQGFDVVGISQDRDRAALASFLKQNKMPWREVFDGMGGTVARRYGVVSIPFGLLVGRDGKITAVEVRGPDLGPAIQRALAKKTAAL